MKYFILFNVFTIGFAQASFHKKCKSIKKCAKFISQELEVNFYYPKKFQGDLENYKGAEVKKDDYLKIFDHLLVETGYARIKIDDKNFKIINARDIRYTPLKVIFVNEKNYLEKIPNDNMFYHVEFEGSHKLDMTRFVRNSRPFMSRYGRILDRKQSNTGAIMDTGANIRRILAPFWRK